MIPGDSGRVGCDLLETFFGGILYLLTEADWVT